MRTHPPRRSRAFLVTSTIALSAAFFAVAIGVWSVQGGQLDTLADARRAAQPFPTVSVGTPLEITGTLEHAGDQYLITGTRQYPHGLFITNGQSPRLETALGSQAGKQVHVFGALPNPGDSTIALLWMNGESFVDQDGDIPSFPAPLFAELLPTFSATEQTCIRTALGTTAFTALMASSGQPTTDQVALLNPCLVGEGSQ